MATPPELQTRRVLLTLAAGGADAASLRAGVALAAALSAELDALFLEDADLFTLSALPFAREILPSGTERPVAAEALAGALRAQAAHLREELARQAEPARVKWSFRTLRARRLNTLLELAVGQEVTIAAWARRTRWQAHPGVSRAARPVVLAYAGPQPPPNALAIAAQLTRNLNTELVLLGPEDALPVALEGGLRVRRLARADSSMPGLLDALAALPAEALVLPAAELAAYRPAEVGRLLDAVAVPVVLVR